MLPPDAPLIILKAWYSLYYVMSFTACAFSCSRLFSFRFHSHWSHSEFRYILTKQVAVEMTNSTWPSWHGRGNWNRQLLVVWKVKVQAICVWSTMNVEIEDWINAQSRWRPTTYEFKYSFKLISKLEGGIFYFDSVRGKFKSNKLCK